jgi:hypothetical protein
MNIPSLLLSDADKNRKHLLATGRTSIEISWQDITAWNASRQPDSHFRLKTKMGIVAPKSDTICIKRDFANNYSISRHSSNQEEQKLLNFARRFLPVSIEIGNT